MQRSGFLITRLIFPTTEGACPVTIDDGVIDVTSSDGFTYYPNLGPSITSMESEQITTGEGVLVTLHGSEFG